MNVFKHAMLLLALLHISSFVFSQNTDSTKTVSSFAASVTVTNNGISLLPNLNLGKPAAIFVLNMARGRFTFDPEMRFSLEGKPWTFLYWFRYKLVQNNNFSLGIGAHPAFSFSIKNFIALDGILQEQTVVYRYLASEIVPNYQVSKNVSVGVYYLISHGFEPQATQITNFFSLRSTISNIKLTDEYSLRFSPQFYFLNLDGKEGFYFSSAQTLSKKNFPLSISSIISRAINTNIPGNNFVWNISLVYSFSKKYVWI